MAKKRGQCSGVKWMGVACLALIVLSISVKSPLVVNWFADNNSPFTNLPFIRGNYTVLEQQLGWSAATIEANRQASLAFFNARFGIPISGAVLDPITLVTSIPNYGTVYVQYFDNAGAYVPTSGNVFDLLFGFFSPHLQVGEFCFESSTNTEAWGGQYVELLEILEGPYPVAPLIQFKQTVCRGTYYVKSGDNRETFDIVQASSRFPLSQVIVGPTQVGVIYEEEDFVSQRLGQGCAKLSIQTAPSAAFGYQELWTNILASWQFPCTSIYDTVGLGQSAAP